MNTAILHNQVSAALQHRLSSLPYPAPLAARPYPVQGR